MKRIIFLAFVLLSIVKIASAQSTIPCGFDIMHNKKLLADSNYRNNVSRMNARWSSYSVLASSALLTSTSAGYVYEIPVVVHIMHTGGAVGTTYNPDSTQIAGMIDYLNKSYAATSPFPDTTSGGCRIPLKFVLAKRTPTGASTNGILRINASTTLGPTYTTYGMNAATSTGIDVPDLIALSRWSPADYYNIYVVHKIDGNDLTVTGGIAGFAYFPGQPASDGMYVVASQAKTGTTTISHEFGHAYGLYHTFQGDASGTACPPTDSCAYKGDLVCDTEPHIRSSTLPGWCPATDSNPCTGGASYNNTQYNIMDYTQCPPNRYTPGQRTRVLNTVNNERTGYKTSLGLVAPLGTITAATCTPTASTPGFPVGPYIVDFNGMNVWTGSSGNEGQTYIDHAYNQQTTVKRGASYTLNVTTKTNTQVVKAFIDYNNDGDFADVGENVYSHTGTTSSEVHSGSITIPATATTCAYLRMRIVSEFTGSASSITDWACGPYVYGQAEDYAIYVKSDTPAVTSPVTYTVGATASALTATGSNLKWYTSSTGGSGSSTAPTPSTASAGTTIYYVSQSGDGSTQCESDRTPISVIITPSAAPSPPTVVSPVNYCLGATASALTATLSSSTDTLLWYTVATGGVGSKTAPTPSTASVGSTIYYVSEKNTSGLESSRASITVNINAIPSPPTVTSPINACLGVTASALTATGSGLLWYSSATGGTGSGTAPIPSTVSLGTTKYYVSQTVTGCESARDSISVVVNSLPSKPTVVSPIDYCQGYTASALFATGTSLKWYTVATGGTGSGTAPIPSTATVGTTNYYVTQTSASTGCESDRETITINVKVTPVAPTVTTPIHYCLGATPSALTASGTSLKWYTVATGGTGSTTAPTPSTGTVGTTNYYVTQTSTTSGCESPRALIEVMVHPIPTAPTVTTPVNYCVGATATALTATKTSATDTLKWYTVATGGTGSTTAPTPSTASVGTTNYYVSQVSQYGCEGSRALIAVVVNALPTAPTVSTPVNYCVGATATALTATKTSATDTLYWYTVATGGTGSLTAPTPSTASAGTTNYYVSQKNINGCEGPRALIAVVVNALPTAPTVTTPVNYCVGATATALTATKTSATDTLYWYTVATGGTGSLTAPTPSTASAGTTNYYVSQRNISGCEGPRALIAVVVNALPTAPTVTTPVNYCVGATATALTATKTSATDTLYWYTVATGGTGSLTAPTPSTASAGTTNYYVSQKNINGCEGPRALIAVVVNALPTTPTVSSPIYYCMGATASALTATKSSTSDTLYWYTSASGGVGSTLAPTPSTSVAGTTKYYVSQKNLAACESARDSITVRVIPTRIYVDSNISVSGTGASWISPLKTVSEALDLAHTVTCGLEIWVKKGTYFPMSSPTTIATSRDSSFRILRNDIKLYGGFAGTETSLTARNVSTNRTILSGDIGTPGDSTDNSYHVMTIIATPTPYIDSNTVVDGFTIKRGNGLSASGTFSINGKSLNRNEGGGLYLIALSEGNQASPRLDSCIFTENAADNGGGVNAQNYKTFSQVKPKLFNCTFLNNRARISGGGMALVGAVSYQISGTFDYCNFNDNQAATYGGGLWFMTSTISSLTSLNTPLSFYKCNFNSNRQTGTGGRGAGMFIVDFIDTVSIKQCNFSNNLGYRAGGLYIGSTSSVKIDSSKFTANEASEWAGAMTLFTSTVSLTNSVIKNCKAVAGGGIFANQCTLTLTNDSINYCIATDYGGGASFKQNSLTMNNVVFLGDTANNGGGMTLYQANVVNGTGCKFIENKAGITNGNGGGGAVWSWDGGNTMTFNSSIFYKNVCQTPDGLNAKGAAYLSNGTGSNTTDFNNCLFANNKALGTSDDGGGAVMLNTGTANFRSSSFSENTTTSTTKPNGNTISTNSGTTLGLTNTIVWGAAANQVNALGTSTYSYSLVKGLGLSAPNLSVDPRFVNAASPAGTDGIWLTADDGLELLPCSPAVNAGLATTPTTDIRNRARFGGFTDMGAYEEQTGILPTAPITTSPITYCQGATAAVLTATKSSATDTLKWYDKTMTLLSAAPTPSTATAGNDTFYVSQTNIVGCESAKARIIITINPGGTAPTFTTPVTYCQDATTATLSATGTGIKWYTTPIGGTATTTAPTPSSTIPKIITYYLTTTSVLGCETYPRAVFNVVINPKPDSVKATALSATAFCIGDSVILNGSTSVFNGFGSTDFMKGSAASGTPFACDCPNGSVVVGYEGSTGALVDQFRLICKPINRFGVLGATTSVTAYNGINPGPVAVSPILFSGTGMLTGIRAIGTVWPGPSLYTYLGGVTGYGQNQSYITSLGDNSSSPDS
jgi:hypothetical protein